MLGIKIINELGIDAVSITVTKTGLEKSIIDAIYPLRELFKNKNFHNYDLQKKGPTHKSIHHINLLTSDKKIDCQISLYRPETKNGDPRLWIYGLKEYINKNDNILFLFKDNDLYLINISKYNLDEIFFSNTNNAIYEFLNSFKYLESFATELLEKIRLIANRGWIRGGEGDKEVGEVLERALNISANSNQGPDYKGKIELKAKFNLTTRANLFAKVPEYTHPLSKIGKILEIADIFGYEEKEFMVLRNTTSAIRQNSQSLYFEVDFENELLFETTSRTEGPKNFAVWRFSTLTEALNIKHKETFWVEADRKKEGGIYYFKYKRIIHTLNPKSYLMPTFIKKGMITMDHLIVPNEARTGRKERGPLFKIKPSDITKLIPEVGIYDL